MTSPSAQEAAATEEPTLSLTSLPTPLSHRILLLLDVDERARAACVSPAWRDLLADPALWTRLDLAALQLRGYERSYDAAYFNTVLRCAARRACGQLHRLEIFGDWYRRDYHVWWPALHDVLAANAGSLRELHISRVRLEGDITYYSSGYLVSFNKALASAAAAAPMLEFCETTEVWAGLEDAVRLMRTDPPLTMPVRLHTLEVCLPGALGEVDFRPFVAALADATVQPALTALRFHGNHEFLPESLVDALLARRTVRSLICFRTPPDAAPLARLLEGGVLLHLDLVGNAFEDAADAPLLAEALRANTTLTSLGLCGNSEFEPAEQVELGTLFCALVRHRSLRELKIWSPCEETCGFLAVIVAADAPALESLDLGKHNLSDVGLSPLVAALPLNHHLRILKFSSNSMSQKFAAQRLLPAVRSNTGLRKLSVKCYDASSKWPTVIAAEQLVQCRR